MQNQYHRRIEIIKNIKNPINIIYNIIEYKAFNFLLSFVEFDLIMSYAEATFNFGNKFKFKNFFGILS